MKLKSLENKVVLITGASAGIGRATARLFGEKKAKVGLLARNLERLNETKKEVESAGGEALVLQADVASYKQVYEAGEKVIKEFGTIDIWVNNSMTSVFGEVQDIHPNEFVRVTHTTYLGVVYGTLFALQHMLKKGEGTILQIGDSMAYRSVPLQAPYCAAKHAVVGFTDSLRTELIHDRHKNIDVTMVHLPGVNTPQFNWMKVKGFKNFPRPLPPVYQPEIAAQAILRAAMNPDRREHLVEFSTKKAVWVQRLFPKLAEWYTSRKAFESQLSNKELSEKRQNNLWTSPNVDYRAHGDFNDEAKSS